jgi:hypothetical protein
MAGKIKHRFQSSVPDEGISTEVGPDEWNDSFVVSEGNDGAAMVRRTSATDGWETIYLGAPLAFINATQAANSGTGETDLHTFTFPVDHFNANKRAVRFILKGSFAANGNTKTLRFKWGAAAAIVLNPVTAAPNGVRFEVEIVVIRTGVDAQDVYIKSLVGLAGYDLVSKTARTEDDGATIVGKVTGQSGTASSDILLDLTTVEYLN